MDKYQELYTIIYPIENAKSRDGVQYEGLCPFHEDHNNSFGYRTDTGVCNCFVGCISGGAYDYCIQRGMAEIDARKYFNGDNKNWTPTPTFPPPKRTKSNEQIRKDVDRFIQNRKNKTHLLPKHWTEEIMDENGIGIEEQDNLVFPYKDHNGELIGYKVHKLSTVGGVKNHWYPAQFINEFDHDKALYIVEGEKDVLTLLSYGFQAISVTAGANSIPKKTIDLIKYFNGDIYIVYDHDDAGYGGGSKVGAFIKSELPSHMVYTAKWRDDLPKGYDCTDAFIHSPVGENFFEALDNRVEILKQENEKRKGFETMTLDKFREAKFEPQYPLINNIMDKGSISLIAGDEGTGKSWVILSAALSLASGVPLFDYFEIHSMEVDDSE